MQEPLRHMVINPVALHSLQSASHNAASLLSLAFQAGMHRQGEARGEEGSETHTGLKLLPWRK